MDLKSFYFSYPTETTPLVFSVHNYLQCYYLFQKENSTWRFASTVYRRHAGTDSQTHSVPIKLDLELLSNQFSLEIYFI